MFFIRKAKYIIILKGGEIMNKQLNGLSRAKLAVLHDFQNKIGINFENEELLVTAFTHSSYVNDHASQKLADYERLEFLGDAVLQIIISRHLYDKYPDMPEGELTKLRAMVVCEESLAAISNELKFSEVMILGRGEAKFGGRQKASILADMFEAVLGAIYLEKGLEVAEEFLSKVMYPKINDGDFSHVMDYKTALQEYVQKDHIGVLSYKIVFEEGPSHDKNFEAHVFLDEKVIGKGFGKSKKNAEKVAAKDALNKLKRSH